ncbi:hypothetical protein TNCV_1634111 [Trichonephila clavipes]|nr:hypothetical protein TNCV_1634111 [Trichonephila clavipes]
MKSPVVPLLGPGPYRLDPTQVGNCDPVRRVAFQFVITQSWVRVCCEIPEAMDQRCQQEIGNVRLLPGQGLPSASTATNDQYFLLAAPRDRLWNAAQLQR